jgi:hypothetical protein
VRYYSLGAFRDSSSARQRTANLYKKKPRSNDHVAFAQVTVKPSLASRVIDVGRHQ